jgi:hypothetical protein
MTAAKKINVASKSNPVTIFLFRVALGNRRRGSNFRIAFHPTRSFPACMLSRRSISATSIDIAPPPGQRKAGGALKPRSLSASRDNEHDDEQRANRRQTPKDLHALDVDPVFAILPKNGLPTDCVHESSGFSAIDSGDLSTTRLSFSAIRS